MSRRALSEIDAEVHTTGKPERKDVRVMVVIGTRPEVIKLAPVCRAFVQRGAIVSVVLTGQHRELVQDLLDPLEIRHLVDADLEIMSPRQTLTKVAAASLEGLGDYVDKVQPDAVIVQGDTTSAFCGALAAFHEKVPVAHVEAGLRSGSLEDPFPEELNRQLISRVCQWHFAPTERAVALLEREAIPGSDIEMVGNTVVDSLAWVQKRGLGTSSFSNRSSNFRILVTLHRREARGPKMHSIVTAVDRIAREWNAEVVFPVHPSPEVREVVFPVLEGNESVRLCPPLEYFNFVATLADADLAISDSGGVQEEAPSLHTPVLVTRNTTERPEAIEAGCARLVGTDGAQIESVVSALLADRRNRQAMVANGNPFGDGRASERIVARMLEDLTA